MVLLCFFVTLLISKLYDPVADICICIYMVCAYLFRCNMYFDGLVQDCSNSSALAMELLESCTKPWITWIMPGQVIFLQHNHRAQYGTFVSSSPATCWCICKQTLADICHGNWDGLFMKQKEQYINGQVLTLKGLGRCFGKGQQMDAMLFKMVYNKKKLKEVYLVCCQQSAWWWLGAVMCYDISRHSDYQI